MLVDAQYAAIIPEGSDPAGDRTGAVRRRDRVQGLKRTEARPGQWVVISGIGGLGHIAVQYAVAMGLRVVAVDIADDKRHSRRSTARMIAVNAMDGDPAAAVQEAIGGAHGVLVTAVHKDAFGQAIGMTRRGGTRSCSTVCRPVSSPHRSSTSSSRGSRSAASIVGTRQDMVEALDF